MASTRGALADRHDFIDLTQNHVVFFFPGGKCFFLCILKAGGCNQCMYVCKFDQHCARTSRFLTVQAARIWRHTCARTAEMMKFQNFVHLRGDRGVYPRRGELKFGMCVQWTRRHWSRPRTCRKNALGAWRTLIEHANLIEHFFCIYFSGDCVSDTPLGRAWVCMYVLLDCTKRMRPAMFPLRPYIGHHRLPKSPNFLIEHRCSPVR